MTSSDEYPKFSVLMSVYGKEKPEYLDVALGSIESQTVKPTEIVLVEDGPLDNKLNVIVAKHQKKESLRFKIVKSSKNLGLGSALRLGTKYVTTNWIAMI